MDETDKLLKVLPRYASRNQKQHRFKHPRPSNLFMTTLMNKSPKAQLVCVSATINAQLRNEIKRQAWSPLDAIHCHPHASTALPNSIRHRYAIVKRITDTGVKHETLFQKLSGIPTILSSLKIKSTFLIIDSGAPIDRVALYLKDLGLNVAVVHRELVSNAEKHRILSQSLRTGEVQVLVGTADTARGLDFPALFSVFLCSRAALIDPATYIHLAGRTGRQGKMGTVVTFATEDESKRIPSLENYLNLKFRPLPPLIANANIGSSSDNDRSSSSGGRPLFFEVDAVG